MGDQADRIINDGLTPEDDSTEREPRPTVRLTGGDGNAFVIIAMCRKAMRRAGCSPEYIKKFQEQAMSGDYDNVLATAMEYCDVE